MKKATNLISVILVSAICFAAASASAAASGEGDKQVNINTATAAELAMLPGVGPSKAEAIIKYREKHPFTKTEQIMRVRGIGRKSFNAMSPYLAVEGPTTVKTKITAKK